MIVMNWTLASSGGCHVKHGAGDGPESIAARVSRSRRLLDALRHLAVISVAA